MTGASRSEPAHGADYWEAQVAAWEAEREARRVAMVAQVATLFAALAEHHGADAVRAAFLAAAKLPRGRRVSDADKRADALALAMHHTHKEMGATNIQSARILANGAACAEGDPKVNGQRPEDAMGKRLERLEKADRQRAVLQSAAEALGLGKPPAEGT